MSHASVSVVIPTLNEVGTVPNILLDLQKQTVLPIEVLVVDGYSPDGTAQLVRSMRTSRVVAHGPHVARQRNMGGYMARGEIICFLDADTRIAPQFLEKVVAEFERRKLDIACPWYVPHKSTPAIHGVYALFNVMFYVMQKIVPSGAGSCIVVRKSVFQMSRGFDRHAKFDDIELIRYLSRRNRFGIVHTTVNVSDRRFRKHGVVRMTLVYMVLSVFFALGAFRAANIVTYEFGKYDKR